MAHDVFISYSSRDKAVADAASATLEKRRISCSDRAAVTCCPEFPTAKR